MFRRYWPYIKEYKLQYLLIFVGIVLTVAATIATAQIMQPLMDDMFIKKDETMLYLIPLLLIMIYVVKAVGRYVQSVFMTYVGQHVMTRFREMLLEKILYFDMEFLFVNRSGELIGQLQERLAVIDSAQKNITDLSQQVVGLQDILSNKQARGAFGEIQLRDIVAKALPPDGYRWQATLSNGRRADCLIHLPNPPGPIAIDAGRAARDPARFPRILRHEISHVYLGQRLDGNRPPTWFIEGVAQEQAGEWGLGDAIGLVQHLVVVRMHRDVGVHIAVAGVHVQGDEQAIVADLGVDSTQFLAQRLQCRTAEDLAQRLLDLVTVRDPDVATQQQVEAGRRGIHEVGEEAQQQRGHQGDGGIGREHHQHLAAQIPTKAGQFTQV